MQPQRLLSLDGLRGLAALLVVIYHYFYRIDEIYGIGSNDMDFTHFGKYGVHLFFMISGFVIFMSLSNKTNALNFFISRFTRLYPTFFTSVIITFLAVYLFGLQGREVSIISAGLNLLMFHEFLKVPHVDGVYWTLTVEITFYFWCFTLLLFNKINKLKLLLFLFLVLSLFINYFDKPYSGIFTKLFFTKYVSFFLLGILTYSLKENKDRLKNITLIFFVFLLLLISSTYEELLIFLFVYMVFLIGVFELTRIFKLRFFVFMGEISYSLYLIHQNIGYIIITKSVNFGLPKLFGVILALIFSVFLAKVLHEYIEIKLSKSIKINLNNKLKEVRA